MALPERDAFPPDGFSLADLMLVLRGALHSGDPAAVDASWRILVGLFPLHELTADREDRGVRPRPAGSRRRG
jgi:hypothetical protein